MNLTTLPNDFQRIFAGLMVISIGYFFFFIWYMMNQNYTEPTLEIIKLIENDALILDTPGCKIPLLDPYDKSVKFLLATTKPYVCPGKPSPIVTLANGVLTLDKSVLTKHYNITQKSASCSYKSVLREPERKGKHREEAFSFGKRKHLNFDKPLSDDLIVVDCRLGNKNLTQYIAFAPLKPDVEKRKSNKTLHLPGELSVILVGIDSVSKLNFLRHFKKTYSFLFENLSPYEFRGHTKVGDNTFPNLIPLLTGNFVEHYWNESLRNTMFFDDIAIIWKKYSEMGYRTFFAEDMPYFGTFHYGKRGFRNPPTDYYYRPLALAIDNSKQKKKGRKHCMGTQLEIDIIYKYLQNFALTMNQRPFFAFAMISTLTHDKLNDAGYADEPTYRLLNHLHESGALNKSLLVFFSDHGIRFGKIRQTYLGKFEERMPFMFMNFPMWFLRKYPNFAENLRNNQHRLTTHFDIHATLAHLLNTTGRLPGETIPTPNGLSLLGEISTNRTCEEAKILIHWCPCQVYRHVPVNGTTVNRAAVAIIKNINEQLQPFRNLCATLELDEVLDARLGQANEKVLTFLLHKNDVLNRHVVFGEKIEGLNDYLLTLKAKPSDAVFEGTIRHDVNTNNFSVQGVSRINAYGKQSVCIESQLLRSFCYCIS